MASIQARHTRRCSCGKPWTPARALAQCDCVPVFNIVYHEGRRLIRHRVGTDLGEAERDLPAFDVRNATRRRELVRLVREAHAVKARTTRDALAQAVSDVVRLAQVLDRIHCSTTQAREDIRRAQASLYVVEDNVKAALRHNG